MTKETVGLGNVQSNGESLFWIERRSQEGGREVIVHDRSGTAEDVLPPPYSATSRVHEYGGGAYCVTQSHVYFVNGKDQNIYRATVATLQVVKAVTSGDDHTRFADLVVDSEENVLYAVQESHQEGEEASNTLVSVDLSSGDINTIASGHDFYAAPRLSPNGEKLAFICWDHPNMPFDGTQLMVIDLSNSENQVATTFVAGGSTESVVQPLWMSDSRLLFASDRTDFWNLYIYDESGIYCIAEDDAEYGSAPWQFGMRNFVPVDDRFIVASRVGSEKRELVLVDSVLNVISPINADFSSYSSITVHNGKVAFLGGQETDYSVVVELSPQTGELSTLKKQSNVPLPTEWISRPQKISFPNKDELPVYGYFYEPRNPEYEAEEQERPPLLVMSHGGPTSSTNADLSMMVQFYTSRGWAVLDVDYGGSTGYGRNYRERLNDGWGITDVVDCEAGVRHLIGLDRIDPRRVAIVGGSAGGYTTLRALTTSTLFSVGSSHYGVSDVRLLIEDTHKFESRYIDKLIPLDEVEERSPIHHIDRLQCPVVFFQGDIDFVVPKSQAEKMFAALKERGLFSALFIYEGEGHGFRKAENIETTVVAQYRFFSHVFGFKTPLIDDACFDCAQVANAPWH